MEIRNALQKPPLLFSPAKPTRIDGKNQNRSIVTIPKGELFIDLCVR